jgi:hypothetical protein
MTTKRTLHPWLLAGLAVSAAAADEPPAYDREIHLVYSVNNYGYTDVCG